MKYIVNISRVCFCFFIGVNEKFRKTGITSILFLLDRGLDSDSQHLTLWMTISILQMKEQKQGWAKSLLQGPDINRLRSWCFSSDPYVSRAHILLIIFPNLGFYYKPYWSEPHLSFWLQFPPCLCCIMCRPPWSFTKRTSTFGKLGERWHIALSSEKMPGPAPSSWWWWGLMNEEP